MCLKVSLSNRWLVKEPTDPYEQEPGLSVSKPVISTLTSVSSHLFGGFIFNYGWVDHETDKWASATNGPLRRGARITVSNPG